LHVVPAVDDVMRRFITEWMVNRNGVDACNQPFHDAFHARFGGRRTSKWWGATPVAKAMLLLRAMHREGLLARARIRLDGQPGFPKWVYHYSLP